MPYQWTLHHPRMTHDHLGYLPAMLSDHDPRPAAEQFNDSYAHGGGWQPFEGFEMVNDGAIKYPGDPAMPMLASAMLREERIGFYDSSWVSITQSDGSYEISRMD